MGTIGWRIGCFHRELIYVAGVAGNGIGPACQVSGAEVTIHQNVGGCWSELRLVERK